MSERWKRNTSSPAIDAIISSGVMRLARHEATKAPQLVPTYMSKSLTVRPTRKSLRALSAPIW